MCVTGEPKGRFLSEYNSQVLIGIKCTGGERMSYCCSFSYKTRVMKTICDDTENATASRGVCICIYLN